MVESEEFTETAEKVDEKKVYHHSIVCIKCGDPGRFLGAWATTLCGAIDKVLSIGKPLSPLCVVCQDILKSGRGSCAFCGEPVEF